MLTKIISGLIVISVFTLIGCQQPTTETDALQETTGETVSAKDSELMKLKSNPGESKGYVVDVQNSKITWLGSKTIGTGKHNGTLDLLAGKFVVQDGIITEGEFRIDMKSLHTTDFEKGTDMYNKLTGHLKGADFFDVEQYPVATFRIKSFEPFKKAATDMNYNVNGELTIKDVSQPVFFPAMVKVEDGKIKTSASVNIDRTKWNVKYGSDKFFDLAKDKVISDNIQIELSIVSL